MHWRLCDVVDRLAIDPRTGLVFIDEYGHRRDYTFAEIAAYSARYAAVLRAFGVQQGDRVYVCVSTSAKCVFTLLALQRLDVQAILDEDAAAGATTVIANRKYRERVDAARGRYSTDARYLIIGEECEGWARLDTLAHVSPASPSSTQIELDEDSLRTARDLAHEQLGAFTTDVAWCALQTEDEDWFERAIVQPWLCGCATVINSGPFDPRERLDLVRELDVTILLQRVDDYHAELALPEPGSFKMPRLRRCMLLGEDCTELLQSQWLERFGVPITPATPCAKA